MKELKLIEQIALNNQNFAAYQAFAFDGNFYYFCVTGKNIIEIYDLSFNKIKICSTNREYGCIVYNSQKKYFFAIPKYNATTIVKLNSNMVEIGYIDLSDIFCEEFCITSISYCCFEDSLIISTEDKVFKISVKCNSICELLTLEDTCITKVISVFPGYILITKNSDMYIISVYDSCLNIVYEECFKNCNNLYDSLFNPCDIYCNNKCKECANILLLFNTKNNCSQLFQIPIQYENFTYKLDKCNFTICKELPEPCEKVDTSCILGAIALIQASLAHILNAEGEKIQKVLATSNNIKEILCVNKEVEQMIVKITHLEQTLYNILSKLEDYNCCECYLPDDNTCCDEDNKCICDIEGGEL